MGWNGGTEIFKELISVLDETEVSDDQRKIIYEKMYEVFTDMDWDTVDECLQIDPIFDQVVKEKDPDWFDGMFGDEVEEKY